MKKFDVRKVDTLKTSAAMYPWWMCIEWPIEFTSWLGLPLQKRRPHHNIELVADSLAADFTLSLQSALRETD